MLHRNKHKIDSLNGGTQQFRDEKKTVLGELSVRMKKSSLDEYESNQRKGDNQHSFPPPPPVFQTYAKQLSGNHDESINDKIGTQSASVLSKSSNYSTNEQQLNATVSSSSDLTSSETKNTQPQTSSAAKKYSHKRCHSCSLPVVTGGGYAQGQLYHQHCFKCQDCSSKLEGKFFTRDGKHLCQTCYKVYEKICEVCGDNISKDCVESNEKFYHSDCMKCSTCAMALDGAYYILSGKFLCSKDYLLAKKCCSKCGDLIDGLYYTGKDKDILCEKDYKKQLGNCERCGKLLEGSILKVPGRSYHENCFSCKVCKTSLVGKTDAVDDSKEIYCSHDYDRLFAMKCSYCRQPIVPKAGETNVPRLRALGEDFHPDCFKCETCGLILEDGCYPFDKKPFCMECYEDKLKNAS